MSRYVDETDRLLPRDGHSHTTWQAASPSHWSSFKLRDSIAGSSAGARRRAMCFTEREPQHTLACPRLRKCKTRQQVVKKLKRHHNELTARKRLEQDRIEAVKAHGPSQLQLLPMEVKKLIAMFLMSSDEWCRGFPAASEKRRLIGACAIDRDFRRLIRPYMFETIQISRRFHLNDSLDTLWPDIKSLVKTLRVSPEQDFSNIPMMVELPPSLQTLAFVGCTVKEPINHFCCLDSMPDSSLAHVSTLLFDRMRLLHSFYALSRNLSRMTGLKEFELRRCHVGGLEPVMKALGTLPSLARITLGVDHQLPFSGSGWNSPEAGEATFPALKRFLVDGLDVYDNAVGYVIWAAGATLEAISIKGTLHRRGKTPTSLPRPFITQPQWLSLLAAQGARLRGLKAVRIVDSLDPAILLYLLKSSTVEQLAIENTVTTVGSRQHLLAATHAMQTRFSRWLHGQDPIGPSMTTDIFDAMRSTFANLRSLQLPDFQMADRQHVGQDMRNLWRTAQRCQEAYQEELQGIMTAFEGRRTTVEVLQSTVEAVAPAPGRSRNRTRRGRDIKRARSP